jgi:hypothetical protein
MPVPPHGGGRVQGSDPVSFRRARLTGVPQRR